MVALDLVHLERWFRAHVAEESRGGWRLGTGTHGVQGCAVAPERLDAPLALPPKQFGPEKAIR